MALANIDPENLARVRQTLTTMKVAIEHIHRSGTDPMDPSVHEAETELIDWLLEDLPVRLTSFITLLATLRIAMPDFSEYLGDIHKDARRRREH